MIESVFIELSLIIIIATLVAGIMRLLKQPLIIGYILTGLVVSPYFLDIVHSTDAIETFARMGIILLLFMVGLNLNPKIIKELGKPAVVTGGGQFIISVLVVFLICTFFDIPQTESLYIAVAMAFSSTIVVMKILSDKGDTGTLYGYLSIGYLIIQDLIVVIVLMLISSFSTELTLLELALETVLKGIGLFGGLVLVGYYILPKITAAIAKSQEYLLLFSLGWCFSLSMVFYCLNFSVETGALLAGFTLALSPYRYEISSKLKPIRDFFIILFFILIGTQINIAHLTNYVMPILVISLFVLFGKPLIITSLLGSLGYSKRTSFFTGNTSGQISEFSLIMISIGVGMGHLSPEILSVVTVIAFITISGSSYLMLYSNKLYPPLSKYLSVFEKEKKRIDTQKTYKEVEYEIILFGYSRIGYDLLHSIRRLKKKYLIVDYDPVTIRKLSVDKINCRYGDATDYELLNDLNLSKAKMFISTIPDFDTNFMLVNAIRNCNKKAIVILVSHQIDEAMKLYENGATYVLMPHFLGGHHASVMLKENGLDLNKFLKEKVRHIKHLKTKREVGHEHPKHED
ncbi:MAG: cation:proton antiporter [Candidatus Aenigmarchaeota archaeon]|nr:cation:proton antiporter [Candidatus Aenigmarchaeota archaeon]